MSGITVSPPVALLLGSILLTASPVEAQRAGGTDAPDGSTPRREAVAQPVRGGPMVIDGRLDEAAWAAATPIGGLTQRQPEEGAAATERTQVRFMFDADNLYIGARLYRTDPDRIETQVSRRDQPGGAEELEISLDTYRDGLHSYTLGVTALGVRLDWLHPGDSWQPYDDSFDPVWEARVQRDSAGWTAEMRIPFTQLRFNVAPEQLWGLEVRRWIPSKNEEDLWAPIPSDVDAWASRFGTLAGITGVRPRRRIELLPYVAADATANGDRDPANPFTSRYEGSVRAGGDLKMGLGPSLTLQATVNPDFGQVEADPAVVNLSAFEVFFDEHRPFFTEGAQLFDAPGHSYFYSRRIGAAPAGNAPGDYVDAPETSTILGAAKLTGRTSGGTSLGLLTAVTSDERARWFDSTTGNEGRVEVAPRTWYGVTRAQQQLGTSGSTVGLVLTGMRRAMAAGSPLAAQLDRDAVSGGLDGELRWGRGDYVLGGNIGFSRIDGDSAAVLRRQRSSARYYQRPDADYVDLDRTRTSLGGVSGGAYFERRGGGHWLWQLRGVFTSPGFELNDVGILGTADDVGAYGTLTYQETRPGPLFRSWYVSASTENDWNYGGERTWQSLRTDSHWVFGNFWRLDVTGWTDMRTVDPAATRGGPLAQRGRGRVTIWRLQNAASSRTSWGARVYYGTSELGELTYRLSGSLSARPTARWKASISPNFLRERNPRQYVTTLGGGPAETFGNRYVFAFIQRTELSAPTRLTYAFEPDLTLEAYVEPFVASGHYYRPGQLAAPASRDLDFFGEELGTLRRENGRFLVSGDGPDFAVPAPDYEIASLRTNAVLRWEWRPGSTLYLVWQEDRGTFEPTGRRVDLGDFFGAFGAPGAHRLAIKASYWIAVR